MKLLACLGIVWIIKDSYILKKPREFLKSKSKHIEEFLSCSLCIGFWVGILLAFFENFQEKDFSIYFIYPFAVSAFCWFFDSVLDMVQEIYVFFKNKREKP